MTTVTKKDIIAEIKGITEATGIQAPVVAQQANIKWNANILKADLEIVCARMVKMHDDRTKLCDAIIKQGGKELPLTTPTEELQAEYRRLVAANNANKQQNNTTKEGSTMTQQQTKQQPAQFVTPEVLNQTSSAIINGIMENINLALQNQSAQIIAQNQEIMNMVAATNQRIDAAAAYTRSLEERLAQLEGTKAPVIVNAETPAELPAPQAPQTEGFTEQQMKELEKHKGNSTVYGLLKSTYEEANKYRVQAHGSIHKVADTVDAYGHKGVDGVGTLLNSVIDGATNVGQQLLNTANTVGHSAVGITEQVAHTGVNALSGTIKFTGDIVGKKN
jgi:hypothetical protein